MLIPASGFLPQVALGFVIRQCDGIQIMRSLKNCGMNKCLNLMAVGSYANAG
jgi:hypothetical protein